MGRLMADSSEDETLGRDGYGGVVPGIGAGEQ